MKFEQGLYHMHKRKRTHNKKLKEYPHPNKWIRFLDKAMIIIAIVAPIMTLPQAWEIFYYQSAAGVSVMTWGAYVLLNMPWIIYGIVHKEKIVLINAFLFFLIDLIVTIGAIIY